MTHQGLFMGSPPAHARRPTSSNFAILTFGLFAPTALLLGWGALHGFHALAGSVWELAAWTAGMALLNLVQIPNGRGESLSADVPLGVALSVLFSPLAAGLAAFVGTCDRSEFVERQLWIKFVYNRTHQALGIIAASFVAHAVFDDPSGLLSTAGACLLSWAVWTVENYLAVAIGLWVRDGTPIGHALEKLRVGKPLDYALTVVAWCVTASLLVELYDALGLWALVAFTVMALLVRQMLARSDSVVRTEAEVRRQRMAIAALSERAAAERRDERLRVATHLHDEVIQPLFHLSLLCQVTRQDLEMGRLSDLNEDLPALIRACDAATQNLREAVHDLRTSPVGMRGVGSAIRCLAKDLQASSPSRILAEVDDFQDVDPDIQLVIYQVAKEALMNAVHHARARNISVSLASGQDDLRLVVQDDGVGFDPAAAHPNHFGLLIMRERSESVCGSLYVDSAPASGTTVFGYFPVSGDDSRSSAPTNTPRE